MILIDSQGPLLHTYKGVYKGVSYWTDIYV